MRVAMAHRLLGLVLLLVVAQYSGAATTTQGDVANELRRLQMQIQGFQTQLTEQLNIQKAQIGAMEKLLDNELKAMQLESTSMRTDMKSMQSQLALARKDIKAVSSETSSVKAAMTSLQAELLPMKTGLTSVQSGTSSMAKQLKAMQGNMQSVMASGTAVQTELSTVSTKTNALQSGMTAIKQGIKTTDNKMTSMASLVNQYKEAVVLSSQQQNQCCLKTQNYISTLLSIIQTTTAPTTTPAPTSLPVKQCPKGYSQFKDSCYKVNNQPHSSFDTAQNQCKQDGANLVAIESRGENDFLKKLARQAAGSRANLWTGGNDRTREGVWSWQSSGNKLTYTDWHRGEPNNRHSVENCMDMHAEDNYQWYDAPCFIPKGYICELDLV